MRGALVRNELPVAIAWLLLAVLVRVRGIVLAWPPGSAGGLSGRICAAGGRGGEASRGAQR